MRAVFLIFIFSFCCDVFAQNQFEFKVLDEKGKPIYGVTLVSIHDDIFIASSDEEGIIQIDRRFIQSVDSVFLNCLGFYKVNYTIKELINIKEVILKEKLYSLDEVGIKAISHNEILKKCNSSLKKKLKPDRLRYKGKGLYEQIVECNNRTLEYRREYGGLLSVGNTKPCTDLSFCDFIYFIPTHSARSFVYSSNGKDTLTILSNFNKNDRARYISGSRKIFSFIRAVEVYGPLFAENKYYDFQPIDSDDGNYHYVFKTKQELYPDKINIFANGRLVIENQTFRLLSIEFTYIDYIFNTLTDRHKKRAQPPFATTGYVEIGYCDNGMSYVKNCMIETRWKQVDKKRYYSLEWQTRPDPVRNRLVEKEAFHYEDFTPLKTVKKEKNFSLTLYNAAYIPKGIYDKSLFEEKPVLLEREKAFRDLNEIMDVEKQFELNSGKPYYFETNYKDARLLLRERKRILQLYFNE